MLRESRPTGLWVVVEVFMECLSFLLGLLLLVLLIAKVMA